MGGGKRILERNQGRKTVGRKIVVPQKEEGGSNKELRRSKWISSEDWHETRDKKSLVTEGKGVAVWRVRVWKA